MIFLQFCCADVATARITRSDVYKKIFKAGTVAEAEEKLKKIHRPIKK